MCQRLYSFIFIKIFAFLRPLWPPNLGKRFYFITASRSTALPLGRQVAPKYIATWIVDIYLSAVILLCILGGLGYLKNLDYLRP